MTKVCMVTESIKGSSGIEDKHFYCKQIMPKTIMYDGLSFIVKRVAVVLGG